MQQVSYWGTLHVQDLAPDESVKVLIISERGEEIDHYMLILFGIHLNDD